MDEKVSYWFELAEYDFETAKVMLEGNRYLYVGFMCHQVIEKMLKAYYTSKLSETPPFVHNLIKLADDSKIIEEMPEEYKRLLAELNPMNIKARYPSYKERISAKLNKDECTNLINKTEEVLLWIREKLLK